MLSRNNVTSITQKRGIRTRLIYNSSFKEVNKLHKGLKLTTIKFVENIMPSTIAIRKDRILLIAYGEDPRQVLISSKPIAESFYNFFENMWKIAKS